MYLRIELLLTIHLQVDKTVKLYGISIVARGLVLCFCFNLR